MAVYRYKNIKVDTKKMTIKWSRGERDVDPHMIKHYKEVWIKEGLKDKVPLPFSVVDFELVINDSYEEK